MLATTVFSLAILSGIGLALPLDDNSPLLTTRAEKCKKKTGDKEKDTIKLNYGQSSSIGDLEISYYQSSYFQDKWDTSQWYYGPCYTIQNKGDCEVTLSFSKDAKFSQDEGDTRSGVLPPDRTKFGCYSYTQSYSSYVSAFGDEEIHLRTLVIGEEDDDSALSASKAQTKGEKTLILVDKKSEIPGKCASKKKPKKCDKKRSVLEEAAMGWE
ncbi:hypothetical protein HII31_09811 [Pseudocercospora fuligena]|uniref:Uncharacterized protein n=1 Tax=Pseudocercospora fuligena TaxID=685502 RepID=A0A8H6RDB4_9PEZI|nr:hypothetical protein HII31_09811 [Pseudocercospora fuligena]